MIAVRTWVAAGSSAAMLAGGLLLGAPPAVAAPDPAACLQASGEFRTTLAAAGVTAESATALEQAAAADAAAQAAYDALAQAAAGPVLAELEAVEAARVAALQSGDQAALDAAHARIDGLLPVLHSRLDTPEIRAAGAARDAAALAFLGVLKDLGLDQASMAGLLSGLRDFAVACGGIDGTVPVTAPAPVSAVHDEAACLQASGRLHTALAEAGISAPAATALEEAAAAFAAAEADYDARMAFVLRWSELAVDQPSVAHLLGLLQDFVVACAAAPVPAAPVPAAPVPAAPVEAGPVAVNPGLNVDTAAAAEPDRMSGGLLTAGLLALAVGVPAAAGTRIRRGGRTRA